MNPIVDLRPKLLAVRDQGRRPTCLAFAMSATHEHCARRASHLSVEHLYYHGIQRMPARDAAQGMSMAAATSAVASDGQALEKHWPYLPVQPAGPEWTPPAKLGRVYRNTPATTAIDFAGLIAHLDAGTPLVLGLLITACFVRCGADGFLPVLTPDPIRGGHAVVAVGHGTNADGQHILIRNSWGSGWGAQGHAWLNADYLKANLREAAHFTKAIS